MKRYVNTLWLVAGLVGLAGVAACARIDPLTTLSAGPSRQSDTRTVIRTYPATDEDFPNPERGFYRPYVPLWTGTLRIPLEPRVIAAHRQEGISLLRVYFLIDEFRDRSLSREALDDIAADFAAVRQAGLKVIPRFAYNFPTIETYTHAIDASLARVLEHIDQLAPVLRDNADVIAFMEMGFVGAWGEWHSSSSGLVNSDRSLNRSSASVVERLLRALPEHRMAALRVPYHKQQLFGREPLRSDQAFRGTPQARIGAHNDCFASDATNGGTYSPPSNFPATMATLKQYLSEDNRFVPQGGESCGSDVDSSAFSQPYVHCPSALAELAMMKWSTINIEYHPAVIELWRQEGCLGEIRRRLGYRFRVVSAELTESVSVGNRFSIRVSIANDGWAALYNPRLVEIVLRHTATGQLSRFVVDADPRRWSPGATHALELERVVHEGVPLGEHEVLINLPDPERELYRRAEYSIHLANENAWEPATGFNKLHAMVTISPR